jgi:curved DNA-binding protein
MSDYYSTLGVGKNANADEIKKAYRKMAAKHHPDRGGDTKQFQQIQEAYDTLSDPGKRQQYDNPQPEFRFHTGNMGGFEDMFSNFGFGGMGRRQQVRKNRNVTIQVRMTLKEIFEGKEVVGSIKLPSGREQALQIKIPRGVQHGDQIRFQGLGDDSIPGISKGDLVASIVQIQDSRFRREGPHLFTETQITAFDAMLGTTVLVDTIADSHLEISVPAGIQNGQMINCRGHGLYEMNRQNSRGSMFVVVNITIPNNLDHGDRIVLEKLQKKYAAN